MFQIDTKIAIANIIAIIGAFAVGIWRASGIKKDIESMSSKIEILEKQAAKHEQMAISIGKLEVALNGILKNTERMDQSILRLVDREMNRSNGQ